MPEIVQEIGAYAGLASVVGLAVLSALYFSQARDVKRLREWAGRAPERSGQGAPAVPGRGVAQPQQPAAQPSAPAVPTPPPVPGKPATPAKPAVTGAPGRPAPATPAGQAAPAAAAAATGAGPATAQQDKPAATPAGQNANAGAAAAAAGGAAAGAAGGAGGSAAAGAAAKPDSASGPQPGDRSPSGPEDAGPDAAKAATSAPAAASPAAAQAGKPPGDGPAASAPPSPPSPPPPAPPARPPTPPPVRQGAAATPAGGRGPGAPKPPAGGQRFASRPGVTSRHSPQETAILPPRPNERWYHRLGTRYLAVALVGLLVLGGAAAYGVSQLTGDDGGNGGTRQGATGGEDNASGSGSGERSRREGGAVRPANVTVAVLNGTTVPGLAATLSDEVLAAGFKVGTITNFSDQQLAESVVQYSPGHEPEARAVSRRLGITQREPVNPSSQALAGDATVIVIAGADKAP